jgi:glycosyltransferase involved in cell wall biosynthesis
VRRGIDVRVLTGMPNYPTGVVHDGYRGKWTSQETIDGIPVHRVWLYAYAGRSSVKRILNYLSFSFLATWYLLLRIRHVDVVFVESQPISLGMAGLLMKWLRGVPYVYNIPDLQTDVAEQLGFVGAGMLMKTATALENLFMRQAWTVSTVTRRFIEHYIRRGIPAGQISFLPNGADTEVLRPRPYNAEYAVRLGLAGRKAFVYAGTHAYYHGLEVLIDAAARLSDRDDIAIVLVGKGPVRAQLEQLAAERKLSNVLFRQSPFEEMPDLMSVTYASLVVLRDMPAAAKMRLSKTFPPLSCGVPVIYSGRGESADMLAEHRCGVCVPPEDAEQLADAIRMLADDRSLRDELGANGVALIDRELSWVRIIDDWLEQLGRSAPAATPATARELLAEGVGR